MSTQNAVSTTLAGQSGTGEFAGTVSPFFTTPNIGTPSGGMLTNCTNLPIGTGVSGLGALVAAFLADPSSTNFLATVTGETGTGSVVFSISPTLVTPILGTPQSGDLTNCIGLPISTGVSGLGSNVAPFLAAASSANLRAAMTDETGVGSLVFADTPTLIAPILGTPTSGVLTNCTGLPISTGVSGMAAGAATFLITPTSANLAALVTNETGTGALVFATSPTLVTPLLGTPTSGVLTNCTGLPINTGVSGMASGASTFLVTATSANLAALVTDETGTGALVFANTPTLVSPILGTPTSGTLTNCTGLPINTGVSGMASGAATFLITPTSANLAALVTNETGTGALVFATSPTLVTPLLGTPTSGVLTNCTGLPISTGVSGLATGIATFLGAATAANLGAAVTDSFGTWTPTVTIAANLDITPTAFVGQYMRVGNTVTVSGKVVVDPTLAMVQTVLTMTLPVASTFTLAQQACGTAGSDSTADAWTIQADTGVASRVLIAGFPTSVAAQTLFFSFTYRVL